jgi:NAD+ diphosphatase
MPDAASARPNPLSHPSLDRAGHRRRDDAWLDRARRSPETLVVPVWRRQSLIVESGAGPEQRAGLVPAEYFDWDLAGDWAYLGADRGYDYFAADVSSGGSDEVGGRFARFGAFAELRPLALAMPEEEAALLAYARGLLWWHERHRFCGVCGSPTRSTEAGHRRLCTNEQCRTEQFPRSDPAVIVLVEHEGACLLARGPRFPPHFRSVLAGFVEPGESLEDTVAREIFEECGVRVTDIAYQSSQPWPFPSSLMLGFRARALDRALALDMSEITEADWYSKATLSNLGTQGPMRLPPPLSIARRLVDDWLADG